MDVVVIGGQTVVMGFVVRIFIHSKCDGHSPIDSPFSRAQESLNIFWVDVHRGQVVSRHLHIAPKQDSKAFIFREIIKNKEIANHREGFRPRNASQSMWV